jgi:hypothetical protein
LTQDCLSTFALLARPDFIQLRDLNLSYNDLGPDCIRILGPLIPMLVTLNLSNTKINS